MKGVLALQDISTISDGLQYSHNILKKSGIQNSQLESRILLQYVLKITAEELIKFLDTTKLSNQQKNKLLQILERRKQKEPIAYITNHKEFYGFDFYINKNVLIPRPETEILIENLRQYISESRCKILDLATGSGCIIITILKLYPNLFASCGDICPAALEVTKCNATNHGISKRLKIIQGDWFENISGIYDIITINPPYINKSDSHFIAQETILFEPHKALFAGDKGLYHYKKIAKQAKNYMHNKSLLFLEIGITQYDQILDIFKLEKYKVIKTIKDYSNIERILIFQAC